MKIAKSYLNIKDEYPSSIMEITDQQLVKRHHQHSIGCSASKTILPLESQSHRNYGRIGQSSFAIPKTCRIAKNKHSETAFSILQYQLNDREARIHINNLKSNLERRLQTAKAQGNQQLVNILDKESQEIGSLFR